MLGEIMFKKILTTLIDTPVLTSVFLIDLGILLLHKPPFLFSILMLGGLGVMFMYYGQKLALFKV